MLFFDDTIGYNEYSETFVLIVDYDKMEVITRHDCGSSPSFTFYKYENNENLYFCSCLNWSDKVIHQDYALIIKVNREGELEEHIIDGETIERKKQYRITICL